MNRKCYPIDQIKRLTYGEDPDGLTNPYEEQGTEYQSQFCKLRTIEETDTSKFERQRILEMMENLLTTQRRSYTNPYDSHFPVVKTKLVEQPKDHKEIVKEAELKYFKMNGFTEYQASYDRME